MIISNSNYRASSIEHRALNDMRAANMIDIQWCEIEPGKPIGRRRGADGRTEDARLTEGHRLLEFLHIPSPLTFGKKFLSTRWEEGWVDVCRAPQVL